LKYEAYEDVSTGYLWGCLHAVAAGTRPVAGAFGGRTNPG